jgi:hypothetical protein
MGGLALRPRSIKGVGLEGWAFDALSARSL